jgi:hypothetical protein
MPESDLYGPIKDWFEVKGFDVRGEVNHCDLVAKRNDDVIIVELKVKPSLKILYQALDRFALTERVYIGLPGNQGRGKNFRAFKKVLRRLGVGLFLVHASTLGHRVEHAFGPMPVKARSSKRRTAALIREFDGRGDIDNIGGSAAAPVVTVYREDALLIFAFLEILGTASPKALRASGCSERTGEILRANHYHWFEKVERGIYRLNNTASNEVAHAYPELLTRCRALCKTLLAAK